MFAISRDGVAALAEFHEEQELGYRLLSDPDGSATDKYDVAFEGRPFARRVTFVLDPAGKVRLRDEDVDVRSHGGDLVARVKKLQAE